MEKTLVIFKPDAMEKRCVGEVWKRIEDAGYSCVAAKMMALSGDLLKTHYAHIANKPFFPEIEEFMGSRPVIIAVFAGENVIANVRDLLGPTDSTIAAKGTIRGDLGTDKMRNICHASDGPESALAEIERFFDKTEVHA